MRDVLKEIFLARLKDQPASHRYPSHIIHLVELASPRSLGSCIKETRGKRNHPIWNQIWWEFQESTATLKHLHKAGLTTNRILLKKQLRKGYPIDYIFGHVEFMGLKILVKRPTLIPRSDTETWIQKLLKLNLNMNKVLEIGTGTGCIALGLSKKLPKASIEAVDICKKAISLAKTNHRLNGSPSNCTISLKNAMDLPPSTYDLIISNPPYIPKIDRATKVSPSVRQWESASALHLGKDGTLMHRWIIDMVSLGHLETEAIALELDGTSQQFTIIHNYAKVKLPSSSTASISDDHCKYRAILIKKS